MTTNRQVDVLVIGGGAAGLGAALQLGRMRASTVVIDAGEPRNAPAAHMHSYLGHDGTPPAAFLDRARAEVDRYGVERIGGRVEHIEQVDDGRFSVSLSGGHTISARRLVLATGITDELPPIPGVAERWGRDVFHCPYCHGWEVRDRRLVVIDTNGYAAHQALLLRRLSSDATVVVHSGPGPEEAQRARLDALDVEIVETSVEAIVDGEGSGLTVRLAGGTSLDTDAVVVGPRIRPDLGFIDGLRVTVEEHPSGIGRVVVADPVTGATNVAGVHAVGNLVNPSFQVLHAAADGTRVGSMVNMSLTEEWADRAVTSRRDAQRWDGIYSRDPDRMWSGAPNGTLVAEVAEMAGGRALDVGCGEGADAIWLAQRGWSVTAADISPLAVERACAAGAAAGVEVDWQAVDLLVESPPPGGYDLVSMQYAALLRSMGTEPLRALLDAVAPGGTLLFVHHDMRAHDHDHHDEHDQHDHDHQHDHGEHGVGDEAGPSFDHADFVSAEDVAALAVEMGFEVEVDEIRPRPNPPAGNPHVDDVVFRARRPEPA